LWFMGRTRKLRSNVTCQREKRVIGGGLGKAKSDRQGMGKRKPLKERPFKPRLTGGSWWRKKGWGDILVRRGGGGVQMR